MPVPEGGVFHGKVESLGQVRCWFCHYLPLRFAVPADPIGDLIDNPIFVCLYFGYKLFCADNFKGCQQGLKLRASDIVLVAVSSVAKIRINAAVVFMPDALRIDSQPPSVVSIF